MKKMQVGEIYNIHCYKHDGNIHRTWDKTMLLDVTKDYLVFANRRSKVKNSDGKSWYTKEPAIIYYYKNKWYNVIAQFKETGIYYYCNIASPTVIEGKTIKYIDYDLDLRVFPDGTYKVLDESEYEYHKKIMQYSDDIDMIVKKELNNLIDEYDKKIGPFSKKEILSYYEKYLCLLNKCNN